MFSHLASRMNTIRSSKSVPGGTPLAHKLHPFVVFINHRLRIQKGEVLLMSFQLGNPGLNLLGSLTIIHHLRGITTLHLRFCVAVNSTLQGKLAHCRPLRTQALPATPSNLLINWCSTSSSCCCCPTAFANSVCK